MGEIALPLQTEDELPPDVLSDIASYHLEDPEWDGYERSVLRKVADEVRIGIRRDVVEMTVSKQFG